MRDARFDQDGTAQRRRRSIEDGRRSAQELWFPAVVDVLRTWYLGKIQAAVIDEVDAYVIPVDAALRSAVAAVDGVPAARVSAIAGWPPGNLALSDDPDADWAWGTALARAGMALMIATNATAFAHSWRTTQGRSAAGEAYLVALASALDDGRDPALLAMMRGVAERIRTSHGCYVLPRGRAPFLDALDAWRRTAQLSDTWDVRLLEQFGVTCEEVWLLDALRRHDRRRYLDLLEETRNPLAIQQAFSMPEVAEDPDEIRQLLAVAPTVSAHPDPVSFAGEWNRGLTAPLLLEAALGHTDRLARLVLHPTMVPFPQPAQIDALRRSVADRSRDVAGTLLGRDDGRFLAAPWILHLSRRLAHEPWPTPVTPLASTLEAVIRVLVDGGVDADVVWDGAIAAGTKASPVDALLVVLAIRAEQIGQDELMDESARLAGRLNAVLERGDADVASARDRNPPSWIHAYAALPFAWAPEPGRVWQSAWARLAEQRRSMIYTTSLRHLGADEPSLFLLYAGIAALQVMRPDHTRDTDAALHLWDCLFDAALSVALRLGSWFKRHSAERWRHAIATLCAQLMDVAQQARGAPPDVDRLAALLGRLGGDDELLIESVAHLRVGGVPGPDLVDAIARTGADLDTVLSRYTRFRDRRHPTPAALGIFDALEECRSMVRESRGVIGGTP